MEKLYILSDILPLIRETGRGNPTIVVDTGRQQGNNMIWVFLVNFFSALLNLGVWYYTDQWALNMFCFGFSSGIALMCLPQLRNGD